jgi:hypothetical protein
MLTTYETRHRTSHGDSITEEDDPEDF